MWRKNTDKAKTVTNLDRARHRSPSINSLMALSIDTNLFITIDNSSRNNSITTDGDCDDDDVFAIGSNYEDEDEDADNDDEEEVVLVGYNDEERTTQYNDDIENNNIGLDIDIDIDIDSCSEVEVEVDKDDNKTINVNNNKNQSCNQLNGMTTTPIIIKESKSSSISIMKKENSTNSLAGSINSYVRFGSVEVHEHAIALDDNFGVGSIRTPSVGTGPSVTLGWERMSYEKLDSIEDYYKQKKKKDIDSYIHRYHSERSQQHYDEEDNNDNDNDTYLSSSSLSVPMSQQHSSIPRRVPAEERVERLLETGYTYREILTSIREGEGRLKKRNEKKKYVTTTRTNTRNVVLNIGKACSRLLICKKTNKNKNNLI